MESPSTFLDLLHDIEIRLINNDFEDYNLDIKDTQLHIETVVTNTLYFICECLLKGDYESVLNMTLTQCGFSSEMYTFKNSHGCIQNLPKIVCDFNDLSNKSRHFILLFIGVCALQEFIRLNFSGPFNTSNNYQIVSELLSECNILCADTILQLSLDGEPIVSNVNHPELLYFSNLVLSSTRNDICHTQKWWLLRCTYFHQCILPEKNESLHKILVSLINDIYHMDWIIQDKYTSKKLIFAIESCHVFLFYGEIASARKFIEDAQIITGLEIELSGAMGKRTQYQKKATAQLFVKVKRNKTNFIGTRPEKNKFLPPDLGLQDDVLLNQVAFVDKSEHILQSLDAEEQIVLLGYCCLAKRSGSFDELLQEELMSYINCLLSQPQIWCIYLKSLIMRCEAEKEKSRRVERAVMQMESIINSIKNDSPLFIERQKYFYCTPFPAFWVLEQHFAELLLSVGCSKQALNIYERLQLWECMVECYMRLGRNSCAEALIHTQLQKGESPLLWCLLGDVTEDPENYVKAWESSDHRSSRAQRSLGYHFYKKKDYEKCLPYFLSSLEISHLQPEVWFSVGHAATQVENFELAARAYRQVVMFDDDNFEAWNNLANAYIKTKQKVRAWRSLQEALKCSYEEWRVWENFLLVSTDVGAFEDALRAWHRLLDLKGRHNDSLLLEILVKAIIKDLPDINDCPSSRLKKKAMELFGRLTSIITNEPKIWELYSALLSSEDNVNKKETLEKVVIYQQKALHCYNRKGQWEKEYNICKDVLLCSLKFAELSLVYIKLLDGTLKCQQKTSAKLNIRNVITRISKYLENYHDDEKKDLNDIIELLKNLLHEISDL